MKPNIIPDFQEQNPFEEWEQLMQNIFFNSCFHPNEFGIWSYRVTSLINMAQKWKEFNISPENFVIPYLDTLSKWKLKGFPNIQMKNKQPLVNNLADTLNKQIPLKQKIQSLNQIYLELLELLRLNDKIPHNEVLVFINEILNETWVFSEIRDFIKIEKWLKENKLNEFIFFLFQEKINLFLQESYKNIRKYFQEKPTSCTSNNEILWFIQNIILSKVIQTCFTTEQQQDMKQLWILEENRIQIPFLQFHKKNWVFIDALKNIIQSSQLGWNFLETFFTKLLEKRTDVVQIADFWNENLSKHLCIGKNEENTLAFYIRDENKKISQIDKQLFFSLLTPENPTRVAYCWNILMFLKSIFWSKHIGSERNFRILCQQTLQDFFWHNEYDEKILSWQLYDTFDEKSDNTTKKLAGSIGTIPADMTKMIFLPILHTKNQIQKAIWNNLSIPECDRIKIFEWFASEKLTKFSDKKSDFDFSSQNNTITAYLEFLFLCFNSKK